MPTFSLRNRKMKYLFFVSWFRAREKKLADKTDFDRMIGASNIEESFRVLNDTDYAPYLSGGTHANIEGIIEKERKDFRETLLRMGMEKEVVDVLFLRDELHAVSREVKEKIFGEKTTTEKREESDLFKEVKSRKPENPHEVDSVLLEIYFQRVISFLEESGERETEKFFRDYEKVMKETEGDFQRRDELLLKIENEIIEKGREEVSGMMPVLAFFIKKRRIESSVRSVFSAKKLGLGSGEVYKLIDDKRAL